MHRAPDRIAFGDWYMADTSLYVHFIARSVVGGVFMPMVAGMRQDCGGTQCEREAADLGLTGSGVSPRR